MPPGPAQRLHCIDMAMAGQGKAEEEGVARTTAETDALTQSAQRLIDRIMGRLDEAVDAAVDATVDATVEAVGWQSAATAGKPTPESSAALSCACSVAMISSRPNSRHAYMPRPGSPPIDRSHCA